MTAKTSNQNLLFFPGHFAVSKQAFPPVVFVSYEPCETETATAWRSGKGTLQLPAQVVWMWVAANLQEPRSKFSSSISKKQSAHHWVRRSNLPWTHHILSQYSVERLSKHSTGKSLNRRRKNEDIDGDKSSQQKCQHDAEKALQYRHPVLSSDHSKKTIF